MERKKAIHLVQDGTHNDPLTVSKLLCNTPNVLDHTRKTDQVDKVTCRLCLGKIKTGKHIADEIDQVEDEVKPTGTIVGYRRVSSVDQHLDRQLNGINVDQVFEDKISGKDRKRPGLEQCVNYLRAGDVLVVHSIDRLARNLMDLESIVNQVLEKQADVRFVKENMHFKADQSDPFQRLQLQMLGAFAQFERAIIKERQREGIAAAKQRGVHFGRKKTLDAEQIEQIRAMIDDGQSKTDIAKMFNVSRQTIYNFLNG